MNIQTKYRPTDTMYLNSQIGKIKEGTKVNVRMVHISVSRDKSSILYTIECNGQMEYIDEATLVKIAE